MLSIATDDGLFPLSGEGDLGTPLLKGAVTAVAGEWAIVDETHVVSSSGVEHELPARGWCVTPIGDRPLVGTAEARLFLGSEPVASFDAIPTRHEWYTPWGAPPDIRSLAVADDGAVLVNVHVGGVWRADTLDDGAWAEVAAVDDDTHQVLVADDTVAIAAAVGFGLSRDGGRTFSWTDDGLHGSYSRAVAVAGDTVLLTASTGPFSKEGAVYRRPLASAAPFEKCHTGLPEWFDFNLDTFQLVADDATVALGTQDGRVFVSEDAGSSWRLLAEGFSPVRGITFDAA